MQRRALYACLKIVIINVTKMNAFHLIDALGHLWSEKGVPAKGICFP